MRHVQITSWGNVTNRYSQGCETTRYDRTPFSLDQHTTEEPRTSNLLDSYSHDRGTRDNSRLPRLPRQESIFAAERPIRVLKRNSRIPFLLAHSQRSPEYSQAAGHDTISDNHDLTDRTRTSYRYETCKNITTTNVTTEILPLTRLLLMISTFLWGKLITR